MSEDGSENEFHSPSNPGTEDVIEDLSFHDNEELFFDVSHSHPSTPNEDGIQTRARPRSPTRPHVLSEDSVFTWPPRHLSSEDYTHLEAAELALPPSLPAVTQEQDTVIVNTMAPTIQDQLKELRAKFKRVQRNWISNYNRHAAAAETILEQDLLNMKAKRDDAEAISEDLYDLLELFTDSDSTRLVLKEVTDGIEQIHRQMSILYKNFNDGNPRTEATPPAAADADKGIDTEVTKLSSIIQHHDQELDSLLVKFDKLPAPSGETTSKTSEAVKSLLDSSKENMKSAEESIKKLVSEISVYEDAGKKNEQQQTCDKLWQTLKKKI